VAAADRGAAEWRGPVDAMPAEFHIRPRARGARSFTFVTDLDRILLGRGEVCDVRLPHPYVSFHHATVQRTPSGYELLDQASANGTWVRGRRIHAGESVKLQSGDRIAIPGFLIDVRFSPGGVVERPSVPEAVGREIYLALLRPDLQEQVPRLEVDAGPLAGRMLTLAAREAPYVIGRDPSCDWEVPDREASREHVAVISDGTTARVVDRGSKNGVRINGKAVREALLADGDAVEVGRTVLLFHDPRGALLRRLSRDPGEQTDAAAAFEDVERGDEAVRSETIPPTGPGTTLVPPAPGEDRPSAEPPDGHSSAARSPSVPPPTNAPPPTPVPHPKDGRDIAELLAPPAPPPPTVARREKPASGTPDGTDTLIVTLGIVVFVVCLIAIYLLLR
jgi:pSer/pThr/pTyr-binding forkhead associated (FHA) protein